MNFPSHFSSVSIRLQLQPSTPKSYEPQEISLSDRRLNLPPTESWLCFAEYFGLVSDGSGLSTHLLYLWCTYRKQKLRRLTLNNARDFSQSCQST